MGVLWVDIAPNMKQDVITDRYAYGSGGLLEFSRWREALRRSFEELYCWERRLQENLC